MKLSSPYQWTKTSQLFYDVLLRFLDTSFDILESGSSTGHISFKLAEDGYQVSLLEIRNEALTEARRHFDNYGLNGKFYNEDFYSHRLRYDFIWNSGLIQCFDDSGKMKMILHAAELSDRFLAFYPDTDSATKEKGSNPLEIPGVGDAVEYSVENIPLLFCSTFNKVFFGRILGSTIDMPFDMLWVYGRK